MIIDITILLALTLLNGLLAMSELAIVSARPARLKVLAARGSRGAATALRLAEEPGRFLSSVQIGITLVGILSGAISGATLGLRLSEALHAMGLSTAMSNTLGVGGVVAAITYLSLILGELVPKQLALRNPEAVATRVAPMMSMIATIAAPIVWLLDLSGRLVLRLLGQGAEASRETSDEEVRMVISEAESSGNMDKAETRMIASVMRVADRTARTMMTPRSDLDMIEADTTPAQAMARFRETRSVRLVVTEGPDGEVLGVLGLQDMSNLHNNAPDIRPIISHAPAVPESLPALAAIETLRHAPTRTLLVFDEYGSFEGTVTTLDVLEAIAGDFTAEADQDEARITTRDDGSLLVSGWMAADELADQLGLTLPRNRDYATVAGLVLELAGHLPQVGEHVDLDGWRIEVVDLDGRRIDKLLVARA